MRRLLGISGVCVALTALGLSGKMDSVAVNFVGSEKLLDQESNITMSDDLVEQLASILIKSRTLQPEVRSSLESALTSRNFPEVLKITGNYMLCLAANGKTKKTAGLLEGAKQANKNREEKMSNVDDNAEPPAIEFLDDPDETKRVESIVIKIIEQFDSEALGFKSSREGVLLCDTPIQRLENLCTVYKVEELAKLEIIKSLKDIMQKKADKRLYPHVWSLSQILNGI